MRDEFEKLVKEIENYGCGCDHLYGVNCNIHKQIENLRKLFDKLLDKWNILSGGWNYENVYIFS